MVENRAASQGGSDGIEAALASHFLLRIRQLTSFETIILRGEGSQWGHCGRRLG